MYSCGSARARDRVFIEMSRAGRAPTWGRAYPHGEGHIHMGLAYPTGESSAGAIARWRRRSAALPSSTRVRGRPCHRGAQDLGDAGADLRGVAAHDGIGALLRGDRPLGVLAQRHAGDAQGGGFLLDVRRQSRSAQASPASSGPAFRVTLRLGADEIGSSSSEPRPAASMRCRVRGCSGNTSGVSRAISPSTPPASCATQHLGIVDVRGAMPGWPRMPNPFRKRAVFSASARAPIVFAAGTAASRL